MNESVKIFYKGDCGNAPKKKLLLEWNTALAKGDIDFVAQHIKDTAVWDRVGIGKSEGKEQLIETLKNMMEQPITELHIDHIITHGYTAALHGMKTYGERQCRFCDVYIFDGASKHAKIKEITTYAIEI